ncbi:hypothetical protein K9N68_33095 [Kovacikia minuta CCNUW1]|uniref:hypothetical protein n=1 Tax=Kovacikia minuta TaxID=2931930 RepID=UPI001CCADC92|nr:hypothetical protein [Kovacikia minuta]UBF26287.1 hypothetical protein K9N68_33095 [Kovacikia minuta CCNUW1]
MKLSSIDPFFSESPIKMLTKPVPGVMVLQEGSAPYVRFAGTLWRWKPYENCPFGKVVNGQPVMIMASQGNCLLIQMEMPHE